MSADSETGGGLGTPRPHPDLPSFPTELALPSTVSPMSSTRKSVTQNLPGTLNSKTPSPFRPLVQLKSGVSPPAQLARSSDSSVSTGDQSAGELVPAELAGVNSPCRCPVWLLIVSPGSACLFNSSA